jgi:hypothetical protein
MTSRALILAVSACVACKSDKPAPAAGNASGASPPPAVAEAPKPPPPPAPVIDAAPPPATFSQTITADGVGPITADTEVASLKSLFPGLKVDVQHEEGEDHSSDTYVFTAGTSHAFDVVVDNFRSSIRVFRVDVWNGLFATKDNIRVGSTVADFVAKDDTLVCKRETYEPNTEHFDHALLCETAKLPNLAFYLDDKALPGSDGKVLLARVAPLKFVRIIWKNPKKPPPEPPPAPAGSGSAG